jgi:putative phosphoesterase
VRRVSPRRSGPTRVGILSDTHGLLRHEAVAALTGSDFIVHAGDVGDPAILAALGELAPVTAVRGNVDVQPWADALPDTDVVEIGGHRLYVLHDLHRLDLDPVAAGVDAVVFGHFHRPLIERHEGVLFLNPGSCGPRRFDLPVTLLRLTIAGAALEATIVDLSTS